MAVDLDLPLAEQLGEFAALGQLDWMARPIFQIEVVGLDRPVMGHPAVLLR